MNAESTPLFSIITACFNSDATIAFTIDGLEKQLFKDFEWIVIDGGSSDRTLELVEASAIKRRRVISEPDNGIYDAMNKGISLARGRYLAFLNSDDGYPSNTLLEVQAAITQWNETEDPPIIYADMYSEKHFREVRYPREERARLEELPSGMSIFHPAVWIPKAYFGKFGAYDLRFKLAADYHWVLRAFQAGVPFRHIPIPLARFTVGGRSSHSCESYRESAEIQIEMGSPFAPEMAKLYQQCLKKQPIRKLKAKFAKWPGFRNLHALWIKWKWS